MPDPIRLTVPRECPGCDRCDGFWSTASDVGAFVRCDGFGWTAAIADAVKTLGAEEVEDG